MHPSARRLLESLHAAGVRRVPRPSAPAVPARPVVAATEMGAGPGAPGSIDEAATASSPSDGWMGRALEPGPVHGGDPVVSLAAVADEVAACSGCGLCQTRHLTVPGEGAPNAHIVFVGEGPGAHEDRSGRPFVGPAGQLLDDIITKGMKRRRDEVFICNVVKCRPPDNRAPLPAEVEACRGFLERQLEAVAPKVICTLGAAATHALLQTDEPVGRLRGREATWRGISVIPTYHPAYLLRTPEAKRLCWEDIQKVMEIADRP